jgi:acyl-CoA thioesterase
MNTPNKIVKKMFDRDAFSQWLGIEIVDVSEGYCKLKLTVREEMLNGFHIAHGGIAYSLADSALAFASNSNGKKSLSVETSISHTISIKDGDELTATTEELSLSDKIGVYLITITNKDNQKIAYVKGTVYRTSKDWISDDK